MAVSASTPLNGRDVTTDTGTLTITDNDSTVVTIGDVSVAENGTMTFTATSTKAVDGGFSVNVDFETGTAGAADFTTTSQTLTFTGTANESKDFVVPLTNDTIVEAAENFIVSMSGVVAATVPIGSITITDTATGTITDNDAAIVTVANVSVNEDDGTATITVNLDNQLDQNLTIDVSFGGGGSDFDNATQSVTWTAGQSGNMTFTVAINDDDLVEATIEDFDIALAVSATTPLNGRDVTTTDTGTLTITDNDSTVVTIGDVTVAENGTMTFTATSTKAVDGGFSVKVDFATGTAGAADFTTTSQTLTFTGTANESKDFVVPLTNDTIVEAAENFTVSMSGVVAATVPVGSITITDTATGTITDNDAAIVTVANVSVNEDDGTATITVNLDNQLDQNLTIDVSFGGGGSDFDNATQSVTWTAGQTGNKTFTVAITDDSLVEAASENFNIALAVNAATPLNGRDVTSSDTGTLTITDNDATAVTIENVTVAENGTMTFTATSSKAVDGGFSVKVDFTTGTAGSSDFATTSKTLTFSGTANESKDFVVPLTNDTIVEAAENFTVSMSGVVAATVPVGSITITDTATGTITDNDAAIVTVADVSVNEDDGTATITVNLDNDLDQALTVDVSFAGDGSDFANATQSVTWSAGETGDKTFTVAINDDDLVEATTEDFNIALAVSATTPLGGRDVTATDTGTLTITDNDSTVVTIDDVSVAEDGTMTFTATSTKAVDGGFSVNVDFTTGTAGSSDFTTTSKTLTFSGTANESKDFVVPLTNDTLVEAAENFTVSMSGVVAATVPVGSINITDTAIGTITDNDNAAIGIAKANDAAETGATTGKFIVTQSTTSSTDTDLTYDVLVSSTASDGSVDYTTLSGTVTIEAGSLTADIDVPGIVNDAIVEADETVVVKLTGVSGDPQININTDEDTATVIILDNDTAKVSITGTSDANEAGAVAGVFTVTQSATSSTDTVLTYSVTGSADSGDDFTTLSGTVTIAAGFTSATISLSTIDDAIVEALENVTITLATITADPQITIDTANDDATIDIIDNDSASVSIAGTTDGNEAGAVAGVFTVTQSAESSTDTVLTYSVSGTADSGDDFTALSGSVYDRSGQHHRDHQHRHDRRQSDRGLGERDHHVGHDFGDPQVTIDTNGDVATIDLIDNDNATVALSVTDSDAGEAANDGQFTVTMSTTSATDTLVSYIIGGTADGGTDYQTLTGSVMIAAGNTTATIDVDVINDIILEDDETIIVTLTGTDNTDVTVDGDNDNSTITISDDDAATVSISASVVLASEPGSDGQFEVSMSKASDKDTVVDYTISGTADGGTDYSTLSGQVTIKAGFTTALIDVTVMDDTILENAESVIVTVTDTDDTDVTIDTFNDAAVVTINDNDKAKVSIAPSDDVAAEPGNDGQFTVTMSAESDQNTTVYYTIAGTADEIDDFGTLTGSVTIAAGLTTATIDIHVTDNLILEDSETVIVTLIGTSDLDVTVDSLHESASITIDDDDTATVSIGITDGTASEPADDGQFTVTMSAASDKDTIVDYTILGTADNGTDFATLSGSVTIAAGLTTATINVDVSDDNILEESETVIVTLTGTNDVDVTVNTSSDDATITIDDDDTALVSISATDNSAGEPTNDGLFTVTMTAASDKDTVIDYGIAGTAGNGDDYTLITGSVTIEAGSTTATISVDVIEDSVLEDSETVILTLTGTDDGDVTVDSDNKTATVTITDDDTATASISAIDPDAAEGTPLDHGQFRVTISDISDKNTLVSYSIAGTATAGDDYQTLSGSVLILAGQNFADIDVTVLDQDHLEIDETVIVTLTGTDDLDITLNPGAKVATVTIADDDSALLSVAANDDSAAEATVANAGQFTVTLSEASDRDTIISYVIGGDAAAGDDYTALSGTITIAAFATSATIDVNVVDDNLLEDNETVTVTLDKVTSGDSDVSIDTPNSEATVNITDNDSAVVTIAATDNAAAEPSDGGRFTVTLSTPSDTDTVISYTVTGDAGAGVDYATLTETVTILAGQTTAVVDVTVNDDLLLEDNESIIVTLDSVTSGDDEITLGATKTATVTLSDNDSAQVTVTATDDSASEPSDGGVFTVSISNPSDTDTVISYLISGDATSGDDFTPLTGTVTILANQTSATINVDVVNDLILEDNETVTLTLDEISSGDADITIGSAAAATVTISDNDAAVINIAANDPSAGEPGNAGQFTVSINNASDTDTTITYLVSGDADAGDDYQPLLGSITILAGQKTATIDVTVINDSILEDNETVTVTLDTITAGDSDLTLGTTTSADVTITDEDVAVVTVAANDNAASEPGDGGQFTVTISNPSDTDTVISYNISGDATEDVDYDALSGTVTILAGETTATIDVSVIDDSLLEDNETVSIELTTITSGDSGVSIGTADSATVTISDTDTAEVTIAATVSAAGEPTSDGSFTVSISNKSDTDTVVSYTVTGDATADVDYTALSGSVTILAGETTATILIDVTDDVLLEDSESVTVTLDAVTAGDDDVSIGTSKAATVTITDNDSAEMTIAATNGTAGEPGTDGLFTVTLSNKSDTDTVVTYVISGDAVATEDYDSLTGSVTILAGETTATIDISIIDDLILEEDETITLTLDAISSGDTDITIGSAKSANVTISDDDSAIVSISVSDAAAGEPSDDGQFTVSIDKAADSDTVITYVVTGDADGGDDYDALTGTVTISAGETSATIDVNVINDTILEDNETVTVTLDEITSGDDDLAIGTAKAASITITDSDTAELSIAATDASASESGDGGQFTVSISNTSDTDTVVTYTVAGDADSGTDYTALSGTVTILAGQTTATINVAALNDDLLEDNEDVTVTLDTITSGDTDVSIGTTKSATVTISDNDSALVSISASDANAAEPSDDGEFTVTLSQLSDTATTIAYVVTGDATSSADFAPLTGSVTIAANTLTATIALDVLNDAVLEDDETVIVTLIGIAAGDVDVSIDTDLDDATVVITDTDSASATIFANLPSASEPDTNGQFTVLIGAISDTDTVLAYSVTGTATAGIDYVALSGSITIAAGSTSALLDVSVLDQSLLEDNETVVVTLNSVTSGDADISISTTNAQATVNIADDDKATVGITALDSAGSEPGNDGQFEVTLSESSDKATTINYTITGTASAGDDYTTLSGSVVIAAGETSALIDVSVLDDAILEPVETVIVTLTSISDSDISVDGDAKSATILVGDDDAAIVGILANDPDAAEPNDDGQFTVTLNSVSATDTVVSYSVTGNATAGTDYVTLPGTVTIEAGQLSATIDVSVIDQALLEDNETVIVTLTGTDNGEIILNVAETSATVTIADDESASVSISAIDADAAEPGDDGQFRVTMSAISDKDTVVNYTVTGNATADSDYVALSGSVTIAAGETTADIDVSVIDNAILEENEDVIVTITGTNDTAVLVDTGSNVATVTIDDNETATITLSVTDSVAGEANDDGQFTVSISAASDQDTVISYFVTGDATADSDFQSLSGTVTIAAGEIDGDDRH